MYLEKRKIIKWPLIVVEDVAKLVKLSLNSQVKVEWEEVEFVKKRSSCRITIFENYERIKKKH